MEPSCALPEPSTALCVVFDRTVGLLLGRASRGAGDPQGRECDEMFFGLGDVSDVSLRRDCRVACDFF